MTIALYLILGVIALLLIIAAFHYAFGWFRAETTAERKDAFSAAGGAAALAIALALLTAYMCVIAGH